MKSKTNLIIIFMLLSMVGCTKSEFLNAKPDNSLIVPTTLQDCQSLLDNDLIMNGNNGISGAPILPLIGSDDVFIRDVDAPSLEPVDLEQYTWGDNPYLGNNVGDWNYPYRVVFYANQVLEQLQKLDESNNSTEYNNVKGQALFHRAFMFYNLAQVFAPHFQTTTAQTDLGIPLRLRADVNEKLKRATVQETYNQIITDLKTAEQLLPEVPAYKTRASKVAVLALLARVYLTMADYTNALRYADQSLAIRSELMDFNTTPITRFNVEVLFHSLLISTYAPLNVDTILYNSYLPGDLRKDKFITVYSGPYWYFSGSYEGDGGNPFCGLATDENYLIRAECNARLGNVPKAMEDLNHLLKYRWDNSIYTPLTATDPIDALSKVLIERRKELLFRGLRWTDLRRLNAEGRNITVSRIFSGKPYTLTPNGKKYTWPIPGPVLSFNPEMQQNPR